MNRIGWVAALIGAAMVSFARGQDEAGVVIETLKLTEPDFDDLSHVLQVQKTSGRYDLKGPIRTVSLVFEIRKKDGTRAKAVRSAKVAAEKGGDRHGQFSVQIADLDYLKLGGDARGASRVLFALKEGGLVMSGHSDIAKSVFDFGDVRGSGPFRPEVGDKRRIPLFWKVGGSDGAIRHGVNPDKVLEGNPDFDVLIAYLECELD